MWSWTEMPTNSYRSRARTVWIPLCMSTEICRLGEGHSLCPWECRSCVGKPFLRRPRKCCQLETRASWWCLLQCTCSSNQSVPLHKCRCPFVSIATCKYVNKAIQKLYNNSTFSWWGILHFLQLFKSLQSLVETWKFFHVTRERSIREAWHFSVGQICMSSN